MRSACIPILLFAISHGAALRFVGASQLPAPGVRGNPLAAADNESRSKTSVPICLVAGPDRFVVDAAMTLASRMFIITGVRLEWRKAPMCQAGEAEPVFLILQAHTPNADLPTALGVAMPLEGSHAWVFYDRVVRTTHDDNETVALLAHVMAHEIGHVLEGLIRHSDSGILKAYWSPGDLARMAQFPLLFTQADVILIRRGAEQRRLGLLSSQPGGLPHLSFESPRRNTTVKLP